MERRLFNPREWPVLLIVALVAVIWLALSRNGPGGTRAIVERGGEIVLSRELEGLKAPETVEIEGENGVALRVELSEEGARVSETNCADRTCQRTGLLTRAGESAVCLPGRIVLRLEGPKAGRKLDAETY